MVVRCRSTALCPAHLTVSAMVRPKASCTPSDEAEGEKSNCRKLTSAKPAMSADRLLQFDGVERLVPECAPCNCCEHGGSGQNRLQGLRRGCSASPAHLIAFSCSARSSTSLLQTGEVQEARVAGRPVARLPQA